MNNNTTACSTLTLHLPLEVVGQSGPTRVIPERRVRYVSTPGLASCNASMHEVQCSQGSPGAILWLACTVSWDDIGHSCYTVSGTASWFKSGSHLSPSRIWMIMRCRWLRLKVPCGASLGLALHPSVVLWEDLISKSDYNVISDHFMS